MIFDFVDGEGTFPVGRWLLLCEIILTFPDCRLIEIFFKDGWTTCALNLGIRSHLVEPDLASYRTGS